MKEKNDHASQESLTEQTCILFNLIINNTTDLIWSVDVKDFGLTFFNQAVQMNFSPQYGSRMARGMRPEDLLPADAQLVREWKKLYKRACKEEFSIEHSFNGNERIFLLDFHRIHQEGDLIGISVFGRDISRKKQHMEEVRLSEARYRNLVENQTSLVSRSDLSGKLTFVNPACCKTFGKECRDLIGTPFQDLVYPEDRPIAAQVLAEISKPPFSRHSENRVLTCQGIRHFRWENSAIRDESDQIIEIQAVGFDITDQKLAEKAILESEQNFRQIAWQLELVNQMGLNIASGLGFQELMDTLYVECQHIVDTDTFYVALLDKLSSIVDFPIYFKDGRRQTFAPVNIRERPGLIAYVIQTARTFYCPDVKDFPKEIILIRQPGKQNNSVVAVPLILNKQVIGVISLQSRRTNAYSPEKVSMLENLATQAAIAIQNSQLYENVQSEKALTDALLENIPEFLFLVDQKGKIIRWNRQSQTLWDSLPEEVRKLELEKIIITEDEVRLKDIFQRTLEEGQVRCEAHLYLKNGRQVPIILIMTRLGLADETYLLGVGIDITEQKKYEADIRSSYQQLHDTFIGAIDLLAKATEQRDPYTAGHQERVSRLAVAIAREMGLDENTIEGIKISGSIHDIGKISLPSEILSKPTKLTDLEFSMLKTHAQNGFDILHQYTFPWPLAQIIYQHHERLDGSGYPRQIREAEMLLEARILAVADVVEAMSSHRPYRPALGLEKARQEILAHSGTRYDREVVQAFEKLFAAGQIPL